MGAGEGFLALLALLALAEALARLAELGRKRRYSRYNEDFVEGTVSPEIKARQGVLTDVRSSPIVGWTMRPGFDNGVVRTDAHGFRNDAFETAGAVVVAVFGNSVALGSGNSSNAATLPARLQHHLRQEFGDDVVVLSICQSSWTQIQEASLFGLLLEKLDIRVSIFFDGQCDVSSLYAGNPDFFGFVGPFFSGAEKAHSSSIRDDGFLRTQLRLLVRYSALAGLGRGWWFKRTRGTSSGAVRREGADDVATLVASFEAVRGLIAARLRLTGRKALLCLQPTIHERRNLSAAEQRYVDTFMPERRREWWRRCYGALRERVFTRQFSYFIENRSDEDVIAADFSTFADETAGTVFSDDCHLTDSSADLLARQLAAVVIRQGWLNHATSP